MEQLFVSKNLLKNLELHFQYTLCHIYTFYRKLLSKKVSSATIITDNSLANINSNNINDQNSNFYLIENHQALSDTQYKNLALRFKRVVSITLQNNIFKYLSIKCKKSPIFCQFLINSKILEYSDAPLLSVVQIDSLRKKINYFKYFGPISKVMVIRKSHEKLFTSQFLYQNNFYMNYDRDIVSKQNDFATLYCRSCSNYVLKRFIWVRIDIENILNDINSINTLYLTKHFTDQGEQISALL